MATKITTLAELKELCAAVGVAEVFIRLNAGLRSSKQIQHFPGGWEVDGDDYCGEMIGETIQWEIFHEIDDTFSGYKTDQDMLTQTHVGEAIKKGALYVYD